MAEGTRISELKAEIRQERENRLAFQADMSEKMSKIMQFMEEFAKNKHDEDVSSNRSHGRGNSEDAGHGHSGQTHHRIPRNDLPHFNGEDVEDWLFRLDKYFDFATTPFDQRIKISSFYMTGPAYSWYKWMVQNGYATDWAMFVEALRKHFGADLYENPQESLGIKTRWLCC